MARAHAIKVEGAVVEALPNQTYRVELPNGHRIVAFVTGRARLSFARLTPGATADISLFRIQQGEFHFKDSAGQVELGGTRLDPVAVIRNGLRYACSAAAPLVA